MINLDQTYCGSPRCANKCGKKFDIDLSFIFSLNVQIPEWRDRIKYAYFCDDNGEAYEDFSKEEINHE